MYTGELLFLVTVYICSLSIDVSQSIFSFDTIYRFNVSMQMLYTFTLFCFLQVN